MQLQFLPEIRDFKDPASVCVRIEEYKDLAWKEESFCGKQLARPSD
jgi:hypothetical protein